MRILLDGYWWDRGPGANRAVQRELVLAWAREHPDDRLVVAIRRGAHAADLPPGVERMATRLWPHAASNRLELPLLAARAGADVIVAHNYAPAAGRSVVFIHDVMFEEHPEWFSLAERAYFGSMLPWARRASGVAASTRTEADRIARLAPTLPRAVVTGLGVPTTLARPGRRPAAIPADLPFAVTVGRLNVRKNLETTMLAAARSSRIGPASPLLVVGSSEHSGVGTDVPARARALVDDGSIRFLGRVPDDELAWLYLHAALTVSLSLDEGFGMPAVEAASLGSALLVSDIPVFRETVGGLAAFVDPLDEAAVAEAIDGHWGAPRRPDAERVVRERYSWERAAAALRDAARSAFTREAPANRR